jgi:hypothetical protein
MPQSEPAFRQGWSKKKAGIELRIYIYNII